MHSGVLLGEPSRRAFGLDTTTRWEGPHLRSRGPPHEARSGMPRSDRDLPFDRSYRVRGPAVDDQDALFMGPPHFHLNPRSTSTAITQHPRHRSPPRCASPSRNAMQRPLAPFHDTDRDSGAPEMGQSSTSMRRRATFDGDEMSFARLPPPSQDSSSFNLPPLPGIGSGRPDGRGSPDRSTSYSASSNLSLRPAAVRNAGPLPSLRDILRDEVRLGSSFSSAGHGTGTSRSSGGSSQPFPSSLPPLSRLPNLSPSSPLLGRPASPQRLPDLSLSLASLDERRSKNADNEGSPGWRDSEMRR